MNERKKKGKKERIKVLDSGSELVEQPAYGRSKKKGTTDHSTKERNTCERA
jgi:hypothetical protein